MNRSKADDADRSNLDADFLQLDVSQAPPGGISDYLAAQLRAAIADGRLPIGSRLPPGRVLAEDLHVSRGVVTEAYQRLTEDGQLAGRGRAGTFVLAAPLAVTPTAPRAATTPGVATAVPSVATTASAATSTVPRAAPTPTTSAPSHVPLTPAPPIPPSRNAFAAPVAIPSSGLDFTATPGPDIFDALRLNPARIDLTPGVPDLAAFPRGAWLRAERQVLSTLSPSAFGYGDPRGNPRFRHVVANWLARNRGIRVDPAEVIIVTGVAQALGLIAQTLKQHGIDEIALEDPGSLGVRQHLTSQQLRTPPVPVDDHGLCVDALRRSGAKAVALTPAHQFPTGVVLDGARRRELVRWADETGGLILEDDYDAEHRYDRPPVPALRAMLADSVFYAGSVSKILAPALRIGWLLAPRKYHEAVVDAKRYADLGNPSLSQLALAELMESGDLERHLRMLRRRHRNRRDAMITALRTHLPQARIHGAAAGLHLTITFDAPVPDTEIAAATLARGVKVQPLSWHYQRPSTPGLVLGYAAATPSDIADGIAAIADVRHDCDY